MKTKLVLSVSLVFYTATGFSQSFVNLNFENPILPLIRDLNFGVPTTNGAPGWTVYINGTAQADMVYNTIALDSPAASIHDTNSKSITPVQGNYSVFLQGGTRFSNPNGTGVSIGQTGQIPFTARSLTFRGVNTFSVSFGGQELSLFTLSSTTNYDVYGADISALAGQTGQLLFTAPRLNNTLIDNIQFSRTAVPEPNVWALSGLSAFVFGIFCRKNSRRT